MRRCSDPVNGRLLPWQLHALGNLDPLLDPVVRWNDKVAALVNAELTHNRYVGPSKNADDLALCSALAGHTPDVNQRAIAVHGFRGLIRRQKNMAFNSGKRLIRYQEAETIPMDGHPPGSILRVSSHSHEMTGAQLKQPPLIR